MSKGIIELLFCVIIAVIINVFLCTPTGITGLEILIVLIIFYFIFLKEKRK